MAKGWRVERMDAGRILVVVDDEEDRAVLSAQVDRLGYRLILAERHRAIEESIHAHRPRAVVIGLRSNDVERGLRLGGRVRVTSATPFIFATDRLDVCDRVRAFQVGAEDLVHLPCHDGELHARLEVVLRRHAPRGDVLEFDDLVVDGAAHLVLRNSNPVPVTSIEFSLLRAFMRHRGQVLSKTQLLADVWGYEYYDVNLVEVHVSALRRKLEAFGPRVLHTVRGVGYVLRAHVAAPLAVSA